MADVYYRFVKAERATVEDFLPQGALGKPMLRPGNQRAWNEGLSVWDTFDSACQQAEILQFRPGSYVVELQLPNDHGLEIEGPSGWRGHHTAVRLMIKGEAMERAATAWRVANARQKAQLARRR